jgi:integrase/recombinase XerC
MSAELGDSVRGFLDFLASERRASRHTVAAYRRDLAQLSAFMLEKRGREIPADKVDVFLLRQWLGSMARVVAPPSVARKIAAVKTFFRYLHRRGLIAKDPASDLASPKVRRPLPTFLGVDPAREVMEAASPDAPVGKRDRAVLEVLYGSGLRVSELSNLNQGDIDLRQGSVRVVGKGNKERVVPLGREAIRSLEAYLEVRESLSRGRPTDPRALFVSARGARLGVRQVQLLVHRYGALGAGRGCTRTRSAILARRTCWRAGPICAPSRRCWATRASPPRSAIPTFRSIS